MANVISFSPSIDKAKNQISIAELTINTRKLNAGLIAPAEEEVSYELAPDHSADPIKSMEDIARISKYLLDNRRFRDNMLFIVGINFGLRISDLRVLRFSNIINENMTFKESFPVFEKKTRNTRKRKKNRYITINNAVIEAVTIYLQNTPGVTLSDYMFKSFSNNSIGKNEPITMQAVNQMLNGLAKDLDLTMKVSSHTLRKTFCYWMMMNGNNDTRRLLLLQKMLNHSSPVQTLDYIGLTFEEISEAYKELNLGSGTCKYLVDSSIYEQDVG